MSLCSISNPYVPHLTLQRAYARRTCPFSGFETDRWCICHLECLGGWKGQNTGLYVGYKMDQGRPAYAGAPPFWCPRFPWLPLMRKSKVTCLFDYVSKHVTYALSPRCIACHVRSKQYILFLRIFLQLYNAMLIIDLQIFRSFVLTKIVKCRWS